ncbi:MAG TPA: sialate O-acetylesterase [Tepidisphaeraceae bacterium]|jgi:sialate O-acetylesterase
MHCKLHLVPLVVSALCCLATTARVRAEVKVNSLFTDHAVLQSGLKVPVWGTAEAGEDVTVTFAGQTKTAKADEKGKWRVNLEPMEAGGPHELTIAGKNTITSRDILVGEVWVASGQSNMEVTTGGALNPAEEIASAKYPEIRMYTVATVVSDEAKEDAGGRWVVCTPETVVNFSAVGYFFARDIYKEIKRPVGIIHSSVGGTWAESWTPWDAMKGEAMLQPMLDHFEELVAKYPAKMEEYTPKLQAWEKEAARAKEEKTKAPPKPAPPVDPRQQTFRPAGLFNGKIAPVIPYAIRGVIWWQGEYNGPRGEQYRTLFPTLIKSWRERWGEGDFPFYFVMLESFDIPPGDAAHYDELREAQLLTAKNVPNTGVAVGVDLGEPRSLHPIRKQEFARRLALIAEHNVYGMKDVVYSGPVFKEMKIEGEKAVLSFDHVDGGQGGLVLKDEEQQRPRDIPLPGQPPMGPYKPLKEVPTWQVAGEDQVFYGAVARIEGETIVVSSPEVKTPVAVRYGFSDNPTMTLYNKADLPAPPFRTDDWKMQSAGKRFLE